MKRGIKLLIGLCLLLLIGLPVSAQTALSQVVDLGDGYSISVPASWTVKQEKDYFDLESPELVLWVTTPTLLANAEASILPDTQDSLNLGLVKLVGLFYTQKIRVTDVQAETYAGRMAASYTDTSGKTDEVNTVIVLSDGKVGFLTMFAGKGQRKALAGRITAIFSSFDNALAATEVAQAPGAPCLVSADSADSAQLRVGPGTNRGAIAFLPASVSVTVTGRIVLDNGAVWYQLNKAEAAPNGTAASELWVAADQVNATGDCEHVGETSAPPVIPNAAPPPAPSGGQTNGGGGGSAAAGSLPSGGSWTFTFNATTNASCQGGQNVPVPSNQVFDSLTYTFSASAINANSFRYGGDVFTRVPGTNSFNGSANFDGGVNVQMRFDVLSTTSMYAQGVTNFTVDGTPCSATVTGLTNHR